jgi:hypothetical protein
VRVLKVLRAFNKGFVEIKLIKKKVCFIGFSYSQQQEIIKSINKLQKQTKSVKYLFTSKVDESDFFIINYDNAEKGKRFLKSFLLYVEPNNSIYISENDIDKKHSIILAKNNDKTTITLNSELILEKLNLLV